jgi:hypothetical protein
VAPEATCAYQGRVDLRLGLSLKRAPCLTPKFPNPYFQILQLPLGALLKSVEWEDFFQFSKERMLNFSARI